jgi:hypothetical protein
MSKLLHFPSPDDPRPQPPASSICMPRPVEQVVTNAVFRLALSAPWARPNAPVLPLPLRAIA